MKAFTCIVAVNFVRFGVIKIFLSSDAENAFGSTVQLILLHYILNPKFGQ